MLKKAKVLLAACALLAGASNVQAAGFKSFNALTELAAAGGGTVHPVETAIWNNWGAGVGNNAGVEIYTDLGTAGKTITVGLSTNQLPALGGSADVQLAVWGTNGTLGEVHAGTATWVQASFGGFELITNPLDGDDLATYWNFGGVDSYAVIGVGSNGTMTPTISAGYNWGAGTFSSGMMIEFDTISVPAPAAALLMIPGLVGIVAFGRKKGLKAA